MVQIFYFEIPLAPSGIPANMPGWFSLSGRFFCTGQQQLWRGKWNFKIKKNTTFHHHFLAKNVGFKTWDFSRLILWVLGDVTVIGFIFENTEIAQLFIIYILFSSSNTQFYESQIFSLLTFWVFFPDKSFYINIKMYPI